MDASNLTICTVAFHSKRYLDIAWELAMRLNKRRLHWVVVENTPSSSRSCLPSEDERFEVLPGCDRGSNHVSDHHAQALHYLISRVQTRFVLILDPDYYLVLPDWSDRIPDYMTARGLTFFGAPNFPHMWQKYRHFPCATCMFIDLEKISKKVLDFSPELAEILQLLRAPFGSLVRWAMSGRRPPWPKLLPGCTREMAWYVLRRRILRHVLGEYVLWRGWCRDTGYRVYRTACLSRQHTNECVTPVWDNPLYGDQPSVFHAIKRIIVRGCVPSDLSYHVKKESYATKYGFRERGFPDIRSMGWEEYLWQDQPFGFHLGGASYCERAPDDNIVRQFARAFRSYRLRIPAPQLVSVASDYCKEKENADGPYHQG